ncbi:MAG TPA: TRAP transporter permease [Geminicoccaceae bacterium]|nr:TRAP transporter permease [Geminicoccaceae bacterium]
MADDRSAAEQRPDRQELEDLVAQADTGSRNPGGVPGGILYVVALCWSLFQLWIASPLPFMFNFFIVPATQARSIHLAFAIFLAFTAFPATAPGQRPRLTVPGAILGLAAAASFLYALSLLAAGSEQWLIFTATGLALALGAYAAIVPGAPQRIPIADWVLAIVAAFCSLYLFLFYDELARRPGQPTLADLVVAGCGMVLLLEATRRALGPALSVIGIVFLVYTFAGPYMPEMIAHRGASFARTMSQQWLSAEGVFGIALGVSTSFVFLFVLFGSMLDKAGAGNYFIKVAFALLGHLRGGPAKAAVVSSGLTGLISGSSIANVVTTGTFTIPLMRRVGFSAEKAGAVEVAASVNGQIMPPVMGAAAFLMVEYVGIPYVEVIKHAFIPAIISYIALFYIVHLEALKAGMQGLPRRRQTTFLHSFLAFGLTVAGLIILSGLVYYGVGWIRDVFGGAASWIIGVLLLAAYVGLLWNASRYPELALDDPSAPVVEMPEAGPTVNSGLHYLLPVVVLVWALIVERLSPGLSAFYAVAFMIFIMVTQRPIMNFLRGRGRYGEAVRQGVVDLFDGLVAGARNMIGIGVATAAAGIIVGTVSMTGIGLVLTEVVEVISGGNLIAMLVLVALMSLVLGLGLPTTANYIIVATLMAPIVVELGAQSGLIVPLIAIHLFVFYFGLLADVTPPVGLASFAAAAISRGDPIRTGITGFFYSLRTVALPFIFVFNTNLLLIGIETWWHLVLTIFGAVIAMLVFAAATQAYFLVRCRVWEVLALLLIAFTMFRPGFWMDMIQPEFERLPPSAFAEAIEAAPADGFARLQVEGIDMRGREIKKVVMLPLGEPAPAMQRLQRAGLMVMDMGDQVQITNVEFGSPAARFGLDFGYNITAVLVPAERPAKEWMYVPALLLLGLVAWLQQRRRPKEPEPVRAAVAASGG